MRPLLILPLAAVVLAAAALPGCGRRGALEPPSGAKVSEEERKPFQKRTPPERPFVLDRLI